MVKILVCGNTENNIGTLLKRIKRLKGGPFDYLICCGNFFPSQTENSNTYLDSLLSLLQEIKIIAIGKTPNWLNINAKEGANEIINEKLKLLGEVGSHEATDLSIFHYFAKDSQIKLGKRKDENNINNNNEEEDSFTSFISSNSNIPIPSDILITNFWPTDILNLLPEEGYPEELKSKKLEEIKNEIENSGSDQAKLINTIIYPRYHFSPSYNNVDSYYERSPFTYSPIYSHSCRFISIPPVGSKQKWIYAVNVAPISLMKEEALSALSITSTPNPFLAPPEKKQKIENNNNNNSNQGKLELDEAYGKFGSLSNDQPTSFFFDTTYQPKQKGNRVKKVIENCWFCLNGDKVEEHMITNIGNESYLAIPKGGLVNDHMLIVPFDHITSPAAFTPPLEQEINLYKERLNLYANKTGKSFLFYERNVPTQYGDVHFHIQCIPVPSNSSELLLKAFQEKSGEYHLSFLHIKDPSLPIRNVTKGAKYYFVAEFPDRTRLVHIVKRSERHPLQLGREVAAEVLQLKERLNWKDCSVSKEEEKRIVATFQSAFAPFSFTPAE